MRGRPSNKKIIENPEKAQKNQEIFRKKFKIFKEKKKPFEKNFEKNISLKIKNEYSDFF